MIYADNAATTSLDREAWEAMKPYLLDQYANASQPYSFARPAKKALRDARMDIASCIGALPEEIFFTSGGTESDNWAIKGTVCLSQREGITEAVQPKQQRRKIITSAFEHHAVLRSCQAMERLGYPVSYLPPTREGIITPWTLRKAIAEWEASTGKVKEEASGSVTAGAVGLVSVMYANNEIGTIQPIRELCEIAHAAGALFHTDAVQAVGHVPLDVRKLGVDFLSASAHKFHGPKGIGFLYIRQGVSLVPYLDGGAQEYGLRAGTENIASIAGMAAALKKSCRTLQDDISHVRELEQTLLQGLNAAGVSFVHNGAATARLPGIVSLSFPGMDGEAILHRMDLMGICVSTGSACDSQNTQISHVLQAIGLEKHVAAGTIRISLGKDNTPDEVRQIVSALRKICT